LAAYLGVDAPRKKTIQKTKVQNPSKLEDKVLNVPEMIEALSGIDHFNLSNTPNFEPRRGPAIPSFIAAKGGGLLFAPVSGGPEAQIIQWLSCIGKEAGLLGEFNQKTLRAWKRGHKGHRCFTVVSHPVARLHRVFCRKIVSQDKGAFHEIRERLRTTYKLPLPLTDGSYSLEMHREAFIKFAQFVHGNLNGQTSVRVDSAWASQSEVLKGFAEFVSPDLVLREETLVKELDYLSGLVGVPSVAVPQMAIDTPYALGDIYDADVEGAVRSAYQRDYMSFGYKSWA
jgi:hypothetical protein